MPATIRVRPAALFDGSAGPTMRTAELHVDDDAFGTVDDNHKENVRHQFSMNRPAYD
jgi:hypothetical protein